MQPTEFKKGHVPWNKGLKRRGLKYAYHSSSCTKFKKGHRPKNWKPVGTITIRIDNRGLKIPYIKVAEPKKWEYLARYIWEQNRGRKILPGFVIYHTDCDRLNNEPENLIHIPRSLAINFQRIDDENFEKKRAQRTSEAQKKRWREYRLTQGVL